MDYNQINQLLSGLYKRYSKNKEWYNIFLAGDEDEPSFMICNFCKTEIKYSGSYTPLFEHGMIHLKDHNLLPFI